MEIQNGKYKINLSDDGSLIFEVYESNLEDLKCRMVLNSDGAVELSSNSTNDVQLLNTIYGSQLIVGGDGNVSITVPEGKFINLNGTVNINGTLNTI